ncbi:hypothetical protein DID88_003801 [Monilinia fructigena]|uniref:Glutathione synthetase n=1 Tax=Monilinia fructigena TaxID=38457 RepID=A0A395IST8_9HELO|nr:hypothetical protein DID88_003801 [Monilinia fructigena]
MASLYPPDLSAEESEQLLVTIKDWSIAHGLAVRPPPTLISTEADPHGVLATTAPAKAVQTAYNILYASIAQDEAFLEDIVQEIIEVDDFIAKLWRVHLKVKTEGYVQNLSLGLFRSDYMVHQETSDVTPTIKQVEFNTIASSFGGLSFQTSQLHKFLSLTDYELFAKDATNSLDLPENTSTNNPSKKFEVAVVYLRAGYGPQDYPDESTWEGRFQIERSNAIKCPSILTQLAGAKKVQQVLATPRTPSTPSILNRFVKTNNVNLTKLEDTFTNIFPLDESPAGLEARKIATDPERCNGYVLKPQREGGGNNIYRSEIPPFLNSLPQSHWKSFILMEIITPPPVHNIILRNGVIEKGGVICELGIYGTCLWDQATSKILYNEEAGYLLRTKGDKSEEGGVAAGFGSMDSVALI